MRSNCLSACTLLIGLLAAMAASAAEPPKRLLVIGQGPDGHPPATHEFMAGNRVIEALLDDVAGIEVTMVKSVEPWEEGPELIRKADGVVIYVSEGAKWAQQDPRRYQALVELAARDGGIVALHWGIGAKSAEFIEGYQKLIGGVHGGPDRKYVVDRRELKPNSSHPISRGIEPFTLRDEFYYRLKFIQPDDQITPILQANISGADETVAWAWERPQGGRSFGFSGLHFHENWKQEPYRRLVKQAILWTLDQEVPNDGVEVDVPEGIYQLPDEADKKSQ